jgi:hypothetical protein
MSTKTYEPKYQCWVEKDFLSDRAVMRMTPVQRHFYRALLQAAYNVDTRPYLPVDDESLCQIADAESMEQWQANKGPVLAKLQPHTSEDGTLLWAHKRIMSDWGQVLEYVDKKRKAGIARQQRYGGGEHIAAPAKQTEAPAPKPKAESKGKVERENETKTETETEIDTGSVNGSGNESASFTPGNHPFSSVSGTVGTDKETLQAAIDTISSTWASLYGTVADPVDLTAIIERRFGGDAVTALNEVTSLLTWAAHTSNHWGLEDKVLRNTADLKRHFVEVHRQWSVYMEKAHAGIAKKEARREMRQIFEESFAKRDSQPNVPARLVLQPEGGDEDDDSGFGSFDISEEELDED